MNYPAWHGTRNKGKTKRKDQRKRVKKYYQANHLEVVNSDEVLDLLISVSGPKPHPLTETLIHIHGLLQIPFQVKKLRLAESATVLHHFYTTDLPSANVLRQ